MSKLFILVAIIFSTVGCMKQKERKIEIFETSANGNKLQKINPNENVNENVTTISIKIIPSIRYQKIVGIGGSFTESSASLLNRLSKENREKIIEAYFGETGAKYSLTRTHINSCDFSLTQYSYAPVAGDKELKNFSIKEDKYDIIPMIKDAQKVSKDGFKIISSPWTAPPWMKNNNSWVGGKLLPEYRDTWALYFSKYIDSYKTEDIDKWGITVENEPLGNNNNWESMHYTAEEMTDFVQQYLGPRLAIDFPEVKIFGYDQNRDEELKKWVDVMYKDSLSSKYFDGTAVHWYASTYDWFPEALQYAHNKASEKMIIQTEGCIDGIVPKLQDDKWYWSKEATDWGWLWASAETKHLHPKYVPVHRYARDMIGCFNNRVNGWIDWNMVLDKQGGPNWFKNWCGAPVLVDPDKDEVYFTPIYYTMVHFSKFIRPGATVLKAEISGNDLMVTAVENPDKSIIVVVLNQDDNAKNYTLKLEEQTTKISISANALQTIVFSKQ